MTLQSIGGLGAETEVTEEQLPTLQGSHPAPRPARRPPPGGRWGTRPPLSLVSPFLGNSLSSPPRSTETDSEVKVRWGQRCKPSPWPWAEPSPTREGAPEHSGPGWARLLPPEAPWH